MEPEEYPENSAQKGNSGFLKSFAIYLAIFIFGFVAASFGGGVKDSIKGTANLAANTAKETFAIPGNGAGEFVPLKSNTVKIISKNPTAYKAKPSLPVVISNEEVAGGQIITSTTASAPATVLLSGSSADIAVASSSSAVTAQSTSVQPFSTAVAQNNSGSTSDIKFSPLIYEIRITGGIGKSAEDYIKIFNPNPKTIDLSGWKLRKRTQSGSESSIRVFPDGTNVGAGKVLTWANNDYAATVGAELSSSQTLAANNSAGLFNKDGTLIDAVGWGEISSVGFVEGLAYPVNPEAGQVLLRKQSGGLLVDTQNNSADFEIY